MEIRLVTRISYVFDKIEVETSAKVYEKSIKIFLKKGNLIGLSSSE